MAYKLAPMTPLRGSFMLTSMLGFLISVLYIYPRSNSFGFAFAIVFLVMFVASLLSMTFSETGRELQIGPKGAVKSVIVKEAVKRKAVKKKKGKKKR